MSAGRLLHENAIRVRLAACLQKPSGDDALKCTFQSVARSFGAVMLNANLQPHSHSEANVCLSGMVLQAIKTSHWACVSLTLLTPQFPHRCLLESDE